MGWLIDDELKALGFRSIGTNVRISSRAVIYRPELISLGNYVRVDDFVTLTPGVTGEIVIGNNVHIAAYSMVESPELVNFADFSGLAARVTVYGGSDNYSGEFLTNPCVPGKFREIHAAPIALGRHAVVGAGSVILPGAWLGDGCAIGAMSLVRGKLEPFTVYAGVPVRALGPRSDRLLSLETQYLAELELEK